MALFRDQDALNEFLEEYLGLPPEDIFSVHIDPSEIAAQVHLRNREGKKYTLDSGLGDKEIASAEVKFRIW